MIETHLDCSLPVAENDWGQVGAVELKKKLIHTWHSLTSHLSVGSVAQWLERCSFAGGLSLIYA